MRKYLLIVLAILVVVFLIIFLPNYFQIKNPTIQIMNAACLSLSEIQKSKNIYKHSYFNLNATEIEKELIFNHPCVESVAVHKSFPNKAQIIVQGKIPVVKLSVLTNPYQTEASPSSESADLNDLVDLGSSEEPNSQYLLDKMGRALLEASPETSLLEVRAIENNFTIKSQLPSDQLNNVLIILDRLKSFNILSSLILIDQDWLILKTDHPRILAFNTRNLIDRELASLQLILQQNKMDSKVIDIIDLRYDKPILIYETK